MFLLRNIFHLGEQTSNSVDMRDEGDVTRLPSNRLAIFDTTQSSGVTKDQSETGTTHVTDTASQLLRSFGKRGKGKGQLCRPGGVAVTSEGDIVVADTENCRLQVFNSMGQHILTIGEKGQGRHQLNQPMDVCIFRHVDEECFLVSDSVNACVKAFNRSGSCVQAMGDVTNLFEYPYGVCTCGDRNIVVTDICRHDVTVLTRSGEKLSQFGRYGDGPRDLDHPYFVTSDRDENVIVSDSGNMSIKIFTTEGALLYHFRSNDFHIYDEDFVMIQSLATDSDGNVLVVANSNVYVIANNGRFWEALLPCRELVSPKGVAFSPLGHLIVVQDFGDLQCLVYIFRYPIENFRSLKAIPKPRALTNVSAHAQSKSAPRARTEPACTHSVAPSVASPTKHGQSRSKHAGSKEVNKQKRPRSGSRKLRPGASLATSIPGDRSQEHAYFLGPKSGGQIKYSREARSTSFNDMSAREYDLDKELEIDLDIVHRLRETRCLNARSSNEMSPAHIFGFS